MAQNTRPKPPEKKRGAASDLMDGLVMISQFGLSMAACLVVGIWGARLLIEKFGIGKWIYIAVVAFCFWGAYSSVKSALVYLENREAWKRKQKLEQEKKEARARDIRQGDSARDR